MDAEDRRRRAEMDQLEDKMRRHAAVLLEDHSRALRDAEEFYSSLQTRLLGEQRELKVGHVTLDRPESSNGSFSCPSQEL